MVNAKKKGNRGENVFAEFLRDNGFKAYKDSASGASTHKSDIVNGLDYSMEIKTVKKIGLKGAWKQVARDSSLARNAPLLAIHFDGMPDKEWLVCIHSNDWIELEKNARQSPKNTPQTIETTYTDNSIKYKTQRVITELKELIKLLEKDD